MEENAGTPPVVPPLGTPPPPPILFPPPSPPAPANPASRITPPPLSPPSPPPRTGRGWMVFSVILVGLLLVSGFFNLAGCAGGLARGVGGSHNAKGSGPRIDETVIEEGTGSDKIAVIALEGVIASGRFDGEGSSMVEVLKAELRHAEEDSEVKAVVLKVDSPGGEVLASDEMYRLLTDFQKRKGKPVIASMGNLAASGGYYVSCPCRWIVANEMTITGSIGVIMHGYNYRGVMDKVGLVPEVYKSGKFKDMMSPDREPDQILPEERRMVQNLVDETYARFRKVVAEGRASAQSANHGAGRALATDWTDYADGRVLSGTEAYTRGFVDELGNFDQAVARAQKLAGISHATVVQYQQRYDLADLFHLFGKSETRALKVDLGVQLPRLKAGQMYYLWPLATP